MAESISERKRSHLDLCATGAVESDLKTTLFEEIDLLHDALPDLAVDELDLSTTLVGKRLRAPLLITGMTGGTAEAAAINRDLAQVAESAGIAFGLGSQRAMQRQPDLTATFAVRASAPTTLVLANLGVVQAGASTTAEIEGLVRAVGADALCVHLNPGQELIQPGGDRDFRGGLATIARLVRELPVPLIVKETGCGISRAVGERVRQVGVTTVDVSGAGGTSWVKVEGLRADDPGRGLAEEFGNWGIPTAAATLALRDSGLTLIASGGVRTGLEVAKAIAIGATVAGVALPVFRAYREGGVDAARSYIDGLVAGLRTAMLLTGARDLPALRAVPVVVGPRLQAWAVAGGKA